MRFISTTAAIPFFITCLLSVLISCGAITRPGIISPGASLEKIQSGFSFSEGPAADADGNIYFTDIQLEKIFKWDYSDGSISVYREQSGQANGLMFDGNGRLIICEMANKRITRDDLKGNIDVIADTYNDSPLHMPNDLWIDPEGGIYFSDFLGPQNTEAEASENGLQIYYIPPSGDASLMKVTDDLLIPNGLIGTPDGEMLYVADMGEKKTWSYHIHTDGTLSDKTFFCDHGSDGMSVDATGNVYITGDTCVYVYNASGMLIEEIPVPERPTNLSFGGKDRKTLFITAGTCLYTLKMTVRGAPTPLDLAGGKNHG